MPLGARYGLKRRADAIRLEVAGARLKTCMLKKESALSLRGLNLEECPEEFTKGVPPFEVKCFTRFDSFPLKNCTLPI